MKNNFWSSSILLIGVSEEENSLEGGILKEMLKLQNGTENNIILCSHPSVQRSYNILPDMLQVIFSKKESYR